MRTTTTSCSWTPSCYWSSSARSRGAICHRGQSKAVTLTRPSAPRPEGHDGPPPWILDLVWPRGINTLSRRGAGHGLHRQQLAAPGGTRAGAHSCVRVEKRHPHRPHRHGTQWRVHRRAASGGSGDRLPGGVGNVTDSEELLLRAGRRVRDCGSDVRLLRRERADPSREASEGASCRLRAAAAGATKVCPHCGGGGTIPGGAMWCMHCEQDL